MSTNSDSQKSHIPELPEMEQVFGPDNWMNSQRYLYAVDLFNYAFWWETHEVLEKLWLGTGRISPTAIFIQGIIQIAAALLKNSQGISRGSQNLCAKGLPKVRSQSGLFLGIDIEQFTHELEAYFSGEIVDLPQIVLNGIGTVDEIKIK